MPRLSLRLRNWGRITVGLQDVAGIVLFSVGTIVLALAAHRAYFPRMPTAFFHVMRFFLCAICVLWLVVMVPRLLRYPVILGCRIEVEGREIWVYTRRGRCLIHYCYAEVRWSGGRLNRDDVWFRRDGARLRDFGISFRLLSVADRELLLSALGLPAQT